MALGRRYCAELRGTDWYLQMEEQLGGDRTLTCDRIHSALLWELVQELQKLNARLHCRNCQAIPARLAAIKRHTRARKYKKREGRP